MRVFGFRQGLATGAVVSGIALLSACAPKQVAVAPPPPRVVIPPMPYPPMGASPHLVVPPRDVMGVRQTVNVGISGAQKLWNLRSAYNVAALNCLRPEHGQIVVNYRQFLKDHARKLTATNKTVDTEFKARYGAAFIRPRESYMTQVYNYFALPPTLPAFCDAALAMSARAAAVKSADLDSFAATGLPQLEHVFLEFYNSYEQYRTDLAAWQARYRPASVLPASTTATSVGTNMVSGAAPMPQ